MNNNNYYNNMYDNNQIPAKNIYDTNQLNNNFEQSYIENIIRLNRGKIGKFYMSFPDSLNWKDKVFSGTVEQSGKDHIIISDPKTGKWYLLLLIYLCYIEFDEKINYIKNF